MQYNYSSSREVANTESPLDRRMVTKVSSVLHQGCKELVIRAHNLLSRCEVSARQDAMTYLVRVRGLLVDGES